MASATISIRAHFDGRFIVPDEPVDLPIDAPLRIEVRAGTFQASPREEEIAGKLAALERFTQRGVRGASIPNDTLRRENMYGDDGR